MAEDGSPPPAARAAGRPRSRIQTRNRRRILEAALDVFSQEGFRGATLDQIAERAGMSKPNVLYYFNSKDAIHVILLNALMAQWLAPLAALDEGDGSDAPLEALMAYVRRKLEMSYDLPRESRLFAGEVLRGAPRIGPDLETGLKPLFEEKCALIRRWSEAGRIAPVDPAHLLFSIWAVTQHYADFDAQVSMLTPASPDAGRARALEHVEALFRARLDPARGSG